MKGWNSGGPREQCEDVGLRGRRAEGGGGSSGKPSDSEARVLVSSPSLLLSPPCCSRLNYSSIRTLLFHGDCCPLLINASV